MTDNTTTATAAPFWNGDYHECGNCHARCAPDHDGTWIHDRTGRVDCAAPACADCGHLPAHGIYYDVPLCLTCYRAGGGTQWSAS